MLFLMLMVVWPMVVYFVVDPLVGLTTLFESDMHLSVVFFVLCMPVITPPIILLLVDNR